MAQLIRLAFRRVPFTAGLLLAAVTVFGAAAADAQESSDDPAQVEAGKEIYESSCAGCHAADGVGTQNGPTLIDAAVRVPDRAQHLELVTDGGGGMPGFGNRWSPEEIDSVVSYVRLTFSGQAAAQDDADDEGTAMEELPFTGFSENLAATGAALVLSGLGLVIVAERRRRTEVIVTNNTTRRRR